MYNSSGFTFKNKIYVVLIICVLNVIKANATVPFLTTQGTHIITEKGDPIILRGYGLGGWLNWEGFINGFSFVEHYFREQMEKELGKEKSEYFFNQLIHYYLQEEDIKFIKDCGMNSLRVPLNYRHFEKDREPFIYSEYGFEKFDSYLSQRVEAHRCWFGQP